MPSGTVMSLDLPDWYLKELQTHKITRDEGNRRTMESCNFCFHEERLTSGYQFGSSGIEALLARETELPENEFNRVIMDLRFSMYHWISSFAKVKLREIRSFAMYIVKGFSAALPVIKQGTMQPAVADSFQGTQDWEYSPYSIADIGE